MAEEVFVRYSDEYGPEKVCYIYEPRVGLKGIVVVDNTAAGPAIGGIRMAPDINTEEVFRLARAMTWKNALAGLPHGGGKFFFRFSQRSLSFGSRSFNTRSNSSAGKTKNRSLRDCCLTSTFLHHSKSSRANILVNSCTDGTCRHKIVKTAATIKGNVNIRLLIPN